MDVKTGHIVLNVDVKGSTHQIYVQVLPDGVVCSTFGEPDKRFKTFGDAYRAMCKIGKIKICKTPVNI